MEIKAADVAKLRTMTGAGFMDCRKALIEAEGDYTRAQEIIREKGKLVAAKRADRETTEGAVVSRVAGGKAVLVCLGCETDFVSQNAEFQALANQIADTAIANAPADKEALLACKLADGQTVEAAITQQTGKSGEKHVLAFYAKLEAPFLTSYIHTLNGKLGAIVAFNKEIPAELAKGIAMQIVSMSPISVCAADCPKEVIDKEMQIYTEQMKDDPKMANKPAAMLENIAKGKLAKFFKENTLEEQEYQMSDDKKAVKEALAAVDKDAKIVAFYRFSLND
ncbi:MAG: translation elongation factor Ts [Bacteroidales bacterium]|nr:translation elongation factor Ts [Bacteroidales bacterium]